MRPPQLAIDQASVVIRGKFEPNTITPGWLYVKGLIGKVELSESKVQLISSEIAKFEAGWLSCEATRDLLKLKSDDNSEFERTRDVAVGVLGASPDTPVSALGLNREAHFPVASYAKQHLIGDRLTPKEVWNDILQFAGMRNVTMWGVRPDDYSGRIQVQVQPSSRIQMGVFVSCNDHYSLNAVESRPTSREEAWPSESAAAMEASIEKSALAIEILANEWVSSMRRAEDIIASIAALKEK